MFLLKPYTCISVILRFTTFRHRTQLYRHRKKLEKDKGIRVRLDLTKSRYNLLKEARSKVYGNTKVGFVYADVNCRLKVHPASGEDRFFSSMKELDGLLDSM